MANVLLEWDRTALENSLAIFSNAETVDSWMLMIARGRQTMEMWYLCRLSQPS
jgi:hypothetical protein